MDTGKTGAIEAIQTAGRRADPDGASLVFEHGCGEFELAGTGGLKPAGVIAFEQFLAGANPDAAAGGSGQAGAVAGGFGEGEEVAVLEAADLTVLGEPDAALAVPGEGAIKPDGQAIRFAEPGCLALPDAADRAAMIREPDGAFTVLDHFLHSIIRQTVGKNFRRTGGKSDDGAVDHRQPEAATGILQQSADPGGIAGVIGQHAFGGELLEVAAVKTRNMAGRGHPKIAVGGLGDAGDVIIGQAVIRLPGTDQPVGIIQGRLTVAGQEQVHAGPKPGPEQSDYPEQVAPSYLFQVGHCIRARTDAGCLVA